METCEKADALLMADGPKSEVWPRSTEEGYSLRELYEHTRSEIVQIIRLPDGWILVVDEEGLLNRKPVNLYASMLAGQTIVGDALLCRESHVQ